eukprot:9098638-Alexandrium_andersonii.AAC.1
MSPRLETRPATRRRGPRAGQPPHPTGGSWPGPPVAGPRRLLGRLRRWPPRLLRRLSPAPRRPAPWPLPRPMVA